MQEPFSPRPRHAPPSPPSRRGAAPAESRRYGAPGRSRRSTASDGSRRGTAPGWSGRGLLGLLALAGLPGAALAQQDPSFNLVNRTGRPIQEVYASPSRLPNWGYDRLGSEVIPPGRSHLIRIAPGSDCVFDIRVVTLGGAVEDRRGLDTCRLRDIVFGAVGGVPATGGKLAPLAAAPAGNPSFNLLNRAGRPIREIYASPASRADWGGDLLAGGILPPGRSLPVRLPLGECVYDLRVVYADGASGERRGVNTCGLSRVIFP